jgi:hypothetical protein
MAYPDTKGNRGHVLACFDIKEGKEQWTKPIAGEIITAPVIHGDETGSRIAGDKAWHWVFVTTDAVLHQICTSRGKDVPQTMMDDQRAEVWVCDCWAGQLQAPADTFQLCLAHQVRNLQAVIDTQTWESIWAAQLQAIFYNTMRLAQPAHRATLSAAVSRLGIEIEIASNGREAVDIGIARRTEEPARARGVCAAHLQVWRARPRHGACAEQCALAIIVSGDGDFAHVEHRAEALPHRAAPGVRRPEIVVGHRRSRCELHSGDLVEPGLERRPVVERDASEHERRR